MNVIEAVNVNKYYGKLHVLKDVNITVAESSIFALLGPNGAGKTTFVKSVLDLVQTSSGEIKLNGLISTDEAARQSVAFLPEHFNFYPYYSVEATVAFYGRMQGLKGHELNEEVDKALKSVGMDEKRKIKLSQCSKGMLQRTGIAGLLMGDNKLLILDEPFSGLDPIGIKELKELLKKLKEEGRTIFINSHILSEMEKLCDHMALLNKGELLATGNMKEIIGDTSLEDYFYQKVNQ